MIMVQQLKHSVDKRQTLFKKHFLLCARGGDFCGNGYLYKNLCIDFISIELISKLHVDYDNWNKFL